MTWTTFLKWFVVPFVLGFFAGRLGNGTNLRVRRRRLLVKVTCPDCEGTGICKKARVVDVHSCCGDCDRVIRRHPPAGEPAIIGTGVLWVPLSRALGAWWRALGRPR